MRHHNTNRKFGREAGPRRALLRSLATNLIRDGRIVTTTAKAKELRPYVEKMVTLAKRQTLHSGRLLESKLGGRQAIKSLTTQIAPRYLERPGGYTRISKLPPRLSDNSPMSVIEFV